MREVFLVLVLDCTFGRSRNNDVTYLAIQLCRFHHPLPPKSALLGEACAFDLISDA